MRYHRMLTCAWLYEEERGECRSRCMAGLGGTKVDQMALDWFPLSIIEQQLIILKQARISDAEAQAAFACKDFWCWSLAGSCFAGLRIIGDNNFPSLSSYFGLSASSQNYPMLLLLLGGKIPKVETSCKRILWVVEWVGNNAWHTLAAGVRRLFGIIGTNLRNPR